MCGAGPLPSLESVIKTESVLETSRRTVAILVALVALAACGSAPTVEQPTSDTESAPRLPAPTGHFTVGRTVHHLVDASRRAPWTPERDRELMVSVYYPAQPGTGTPAPYATPGEAELLLRREGAPADPEAARLLGATRTNSAADATPVDGSHPLVVLSPGFGAPRYTLTTLAEDLASHGYVVAAVDHVNEASGTELPDGRIATCLVCETVDTPGTLDTLTAARAADVSFLLDRLAATAPSWPPARYVDASRIGMAGHSIGGAAAAAAMARDPRVRAGANMDGAFFGAAPADGFGDRAFLMLGTDDETHRPGGADTTWDAMWAALHGWKRWLTVTGSDHFTFSDSPVLVEQLGGGADLLGLPTTSTLSGPRAVELTRAYVRAFFDRHLLGVAQPLLDGPHPACPEVRFQHT
ncbi:alpha/beta hydrolase [Nocardia otitidiscaviarum]|uniref:Alpha/beta hydrolase n=1 Tax=Nocardia otitidiscaviarum TaxID=1823 RepID=A0A516NLK4_9NOCA|nr:alpha/beta hydrolase [Nocardia otitidiscaviarum]